MNGGHNKIQTKYCRLFLPLIAEIQSLRNNRLEKQTTFFYDELKISHINPIDLIKIDSH